MSAPVSRAEVRASVRALITAALDDEMRDEHLSLMQDLAERARSGEGVFVELLLSAIVSTVTSTVSHLRPQSESDSEAWLRVRDWIATQDMSIGEARRDLPEADR